MKIKKILGILLLFILINGASGWEHKALDSGFTTSVHSMDFKSNGDVCFVYNSSAGLIYECCNSIISNCYYSTVIADTGYIGEKAVLTLDSNDNPHVAYINGTYLFYWDGTDSTYLDSVHYFTHSVGNIVVDKNNNPHISYSDGDFPNAHALEKFYKLGSWFTITYGTDVRSVPILKYDSSTDNIYFANVHYSNGNLAGAIEIFNHSYDSTTFSVLGKYWNDTILFRQDGLSGMYYNLSSNNFYFGLTIGLAAGYKGIYKTRDNNNISQLLSTPSKVSFSTYNDILYYGYEDGGEYKIGNYNDFSSISEFTNVDNVEVTLRYNNGYRYVLYTHTNNNIYIAYDLPTYTIKGNIYDYGDFSTINNAHICYTKNSIDYCDYSNSVGEYEIILPSGEYNILITKDDYKDFTNSGNKITISTDLTNNHYYLIPSDYAGVNETLITLTFIDYMTNLPISSLTTEFQYISGCICLIGSTFMYTTNSDGKIIQYIPLGDYKLIPKGDYLIYSENDRVYTTEVGLFLDSSTYNKVFKLKHYSEVDNLVYGKIRDVTTSELLANMTVIMYNTENFYTINSNESGNYRLSDCNAGDYYIYGYDGISPIEYDKTSEDLIIVENETEVDIYLFPTIYEDSITLTWNITDCLTGSPLDGVSTIIKDINNVPLLYNISDANGYGYITNIIPNYYNISHYKLNYISQFAEYNYLSSFNFTMCMRPVGTETCYKINGTIYSEDSTTPLQLAMVKVNNEFGTLLTYITGTTGIYNTDKDEGGRCLTEGYYNLDISREGYITHNELIYLDSNISHNVTLNYSEDTVNYKVLVHDKDFISLSGAYVNLTEEHTNLDIRINRLCIHPSTSEGCVFTNLRKGFYNVHIYYDGYSSVKFRKYLIGDTTSVVLLDEIEEHYDLRVEVFGIYKSPINSTYDMNISLDKAEVILQKEINGVYTNYKTGLTNGAGFIWFDNLVKGNYNLIVSKEEYNDNEKQFFLATDKEIEIYLTDFYYFTSVEDMEQQKQSAINLILAVMYKGVFLPLIAIVLFLVVGIILMTKEILPK